MSKKEEYFWVFDRESYRLIGATIDNNGKIIYKFESRNSKDVIEASLEKIDREFYMSKTVLTEEEIEELLKEAPGNYTTRIKRSISRIFS